MPGLETIEDIVSAGVAAQAAIDKHLTLAYKAAAKLTKITERGIEEGMVQGIAAKTIIADARAAQGMIGTVAGAFATLHQTQTDASIAAGADLGSVTTAGGITIGGVGTMGGGR
jgi:hypothetical protein